MEEIDKGIGYILYNILEPAAFEYLNTIRIKDNELCHKICYALFPPEDMKRVGEYAWRIYEHGYTGKKITLNTIIKYERAFKGIKPTIEVERDGKRTSLQETVGARKIA